MPHAFGTSNAVRQPDGSTTITFQRDQLAFHDNFFGGEPYGGRAVIHYLSKPVWIMVYYGRLHDTELPAASIHNFLRLALQHTPQDKPFRGPDTFTQGNLTYQNTLHGTITSYSGREAILDNGQEVYWASYLGGLVDQQAEVRF